MKIRNRASIGCDSDTTSEKRQVQRWFADCRGEVVRYTPLPDGSVLCACRVGTEVQLQSQAKSKSSDREA